MTRVDAVNPDGQQVAAENEVERGSRPVSSLTNKRIKKKKDTFVQHPQELNFR